MLYTDGLTEAGAPEHVLEPEDLAAELRGAAGLPAAQAWSTTWWPPPWRMQPEPRDDIAVLALQARRVE